MKRNQKISFETSYNYLITKKGKKIIDEVHQQRILEYLIKNGLILEILRGYHSNKMAEQVEKQLDLLGVLK